MLFSVHVFMFYSSFLPVLDFQFHAIMARKDFSLLEFIDVCFVALYMIAHGECAPEKNVYSAVF